MIERMDPLPSLTPVCLGDEPFVNVTGETQQGAWIMTRNQILLLQEKCSFLDQGSLGIKKSAVAMKDGFIGEEG